MWIPRAGRPDIGPWGHSAPSGQIDKRRAGPLHWEFPSPPWPSDNLNEVSFPAAHHTASTEGSAGLQVQLGRLTLANPITVASGTFGYAREMAGLIDLARLGAILPKTSARTTFSSALLWGTRLKD